MFPETKPTICFEPNEGDLIIFSSLVKHSVPPCKCKDKRIMIAGNIGEGDMSDKDFDAVTVVVIPSLEVGVKEKPKLKKPRMYKVIILNDDYTPMRFVTAILMEYFSKSKVEGAIMLEIHKKGKGIAGIYPFDIAETKLRQIIKHARKEEYPLQAKLESE